MIYQPDTVFSNTDMICFSHDWSGDPLSKTHLMRLLARNGNRILWVNSIGYRSPSLANKRDLTRIIEKLSAAFSAIQEVEPNIHVYNPIAIPSWGSRWVRNINTHLLKWQLHRVMRKLKLRNPVIWAFNPAVGSLATQLAHSLLIYYCVDEYTAFSGVDRTSLKQSEQLLIRNADLLFVSANDLLTSKVSNHTPTTLVRHGVDYDHFSKALSSDTPVAAELLALQRPVIGYFGLIAQDWFDLQLMRRVARSFPDCSLVLLGKSTMDISDLLAEPNVHWYGRQPYQRLPEFCKGFDVGVIPFPISEVTLNANPLKAREYLAAGLPVVSTPIPEVMIMEDCLIGNSPDDFIHQIRQSLLDPGPSNRRSVKMSTESWSSRLDQIRTVSSQILNQRNRNSKL